jgi:hypothetical protein
MNATLALPALISLAMIWILIAWLYRDYRVDLFRARLFAIRGELFDLAASGAVPFNNPAYYTLRTMLNGFIRFGDRVSVPWAIAVSMAIDEEAGVERDALKRELDKRWSTGIEAVTDLQARAQLLALRARLHQEFAKQILFASPLVLLTSIVFVIPMIMIIVAADHGRRVVKKWWQSPADTAAYAEGCLA